LAEPRKGSIRVTDGRIESLSLQAEAEGLVTGLILPGLIDLHDHLGYAYSQRFAGNLWPAERLFANRYEWQELTSMFHEKHSSRAKAAGALFYLYGEVRELVGGTTSTANHVKPPAYDVLVRNLDGGEAHHGLPLTIRSEVFFFEREGLLDQPTRFQVRASALESVEQADLALVHLAEGRRDDPLTRLEFESFLSWAKENPKLARKIVPIHLVGLEAADFARLRSVGIDRAVWSPASNMALYGETMKVAAAVNEGFTICLGTDWYPSGSDSLFDELRLAKKLVREGVVAELSTETLNAMILESPWKMLGGKLGHLYPGGPADLVIITWESDLESSLEKADVDTICLVTVNGQPLFGKRLLLDQLLTRVTLSPVRPGDYAYGFDLSLIWDEVRRLAPDSVPPETIGEQYYPK
jgi:5-methylthioadenosine/S-adenosylhomocysteine deaminase